MSIDGEPRETLPPHECEWVEAEKPLAKPNPLEVHWTQEKQFSIQTPDVARWAMIRSIKAE